MKWPADSVKKQAITELVPYARNARTHTDEQVNQIAASMQEWGWTVPILVDEDNVIIAGHGRLLAAQKLGLAKVPVMVARGWTKAQKRAYTLADNQLATNAGWDSEILRLELADLMEWEFDCDLLGFEDLDALTAEKNEGLTDPDDIPQDVEATTKPGDLWVLGNHRLKCGDSTVATDVGHLLGAVKPHLMVTDPPYGVEYDASWRKDAGLADAGAHGKVRNDDIADWREAWALFPGDVAYVWHGALHAPTVADSLKANRFIPRAQIIWVKTRAPISRGHYHWQHEPMFYAEKDGDQDAGWSVDHDVAAYIVRPGKTGHWQGDRKQTTVWFIEHLKSDTGHSTQKPAECMRRPIVNNSSPGQVVYDPFLGSGTTVIAAEMEGRHCYGLELEPAYCDIIVKRWEDFTGQTATLETVPEAASG